MFIYLFYFFFILAISNKTQIMIVKYPDRRQKIIGKTPRFCFLLGFFLKNKCTFIKNNTKGLTVICLILIKCNINDNIDTISIV